MAAFAQQHDLRSLLQLSKASRLAILPQIEALQLEWQGPPLNYSPPARALVRLLRQLPNLRVLSANDGCPHEMLVREIGDGTVGAALRSLRLPKLRQELFGLLCGHLEAGRLPLLRELLINRRLPGGDWEHPNLRRMLDGRRALGLPPLVRMETHLDISVVDCCPPAEVTHLYAKLFKEDDLRQFMQGQPSLPALRSLKIKGWSRNAEPEHPTIFELLAEGRAPMLKELEIDRHTI